MTRILVLLWSREDKGLRYHLREEMKLGTDRARMPGCDMMVYSVRFMIWFLEDDSDSRV